MFVLQGNSVTGYALLGRDYPRFNRKRARNPLYNYYECKGGKWIALGSQSPVRDWLAVCKAIGRNDLIEDPRFSDGEKRAENCEELVRILDAEFKKLDRDEVLATLATLDAICAPCNTVVEAFNDPMIVSNEYVTEWDHPVFGRTKYVGFPIKFSETPCNLRTAPPVLGQHTEEVLTEICGYSWDEVGDLKERQVI
jgi:crotonobetainyl-CoA:carnitine CoA-transferase CaiB-like acyl-CoA transferase